MTLYGATDPQVIGQPISPFFGAQNGRAYSGAPTIPTPAQVNAPQVPVLESVSRGSVPQNALVTSVNSVSVGLGDVCSVAEAISNGNGECTNRGAAVAANGAINQQIFVDGYSGPAQTATGPSAKDTSTLTEAPVAASTVVSNVSLTSGGFAG